MQHTIPLDQLGAPGEAMAHAIEKCVHCGFCLPTCPTYALLGEEMDSPRGRILLMKSALEGSLAVEETLPYVDKCLGCLGCVTACPSGVPYGELLTPYRAYAEQRRSRPFIEKLARWLTNATLPYPVRFSWAAHLGQFARPFKNWLPAPFAAMLTLLPDHLPVARPLPAVYPAQGQRRARVALLTGCVQSVLAPAINWATLRVLARNGVEVIIPAQQGCCGALLTHTGEAEGGRRLARRNLRIFPNDVDALLTNAAGCGSGIKDYGLWFKGLPDETAAVMLARKTYDVSEFLISLGLVSPPPLPQPLTIAYHDACHLAHAQGITTAPRRLLKQIPNLTLREIPEGELCCGSAGTYNLEQPALAYQLGKRKAENIARVNSAVVVSGNIGCLIQIQTHLKQLGQALPVYHTLEILDHAYSG